MSEEIKRVAAERGIVVSMGEGKYRNFAWARLRSTDDAEEASSVMVGMHGVLEATDCRSSTSGSGLAVTSAIFALSLQLKLVDIQLCEMARRLSRSMERFIFGSDSIYFHALYYRPTSTSHECLSKCLLDLQNNCTCRA